MSFAHDIAGGQGNLIATQVQSPNFIHGSQGWRISKDGTAEFHSIILPSGQGVSVYFQGTAPVTSHIGDLWYNTSSGLELSRWDGSSWVAYQIGTNAILAGAITNALLASGAVGTSNIQNNAITNALLASAAVEEANIANGAVTTTQIAAAAGILGSQLSSSAGITGGQIASATITGSNLASSVTARSLGGITTTIASSAPSSPADGDLWIDSSNGYQINQYSSGAWNLLTWTATDVLSAATITGSLIAASTIEGGNIDAATITGSNIAAGTITGSNILAGTITSDLIAANAITAGLIAAGAIDGFTINGVTINGDTINAADIFIEAGSGNAILVYTNAGNTTQTFTSSGSWTAPAGVTSIKAECWGAGGGGGGDDIGDTYPGGGGGGGEYAAEATLAVTGGNTYSYTVGAAGTAGTAGSNGGAGGNTTFPGDSVTVTGHGGSGGNHGNAGAGTGGAGGTGSTNTTHNDGGAGGSGSGGSQTTQTFTSSGNWTCPTGVTSIKAECWGAGAGGQWASGPGGGGGEYARENTLAVTPGNVYSYTIGGGGAGGTSSSGTGKAGGNTTFPGDSVTVTAHGAPLNNSSSSSAGTGSTNSVHYPGGGGNSNGTGPGYGGGGGGGGGGNSAGGGGSAPNSGATGGAGGTGGVSGGGAGGHGGNGGSSSSTAGSNGSAPGGGGGAGGATSASGSNGGSGAGGKIILTYTLPSDSGGGGGGGSASASSTGNAGNAGSNATGGSGAAAVSDGGPGGNGGNTGSAGSAPGTSPGGGGGGTGGNSSASAGAGYAGQVRITYQSGTPALLASIAAVAGTDSYSNSYQAGFTVYDGASTYIQMHVNSSVGAPAIELPTGVGSEAEHAAIYTEAANVGAANEFIEEYIIGPGSTYDNKQAAISLVSAEENGASEAAGILQMLTSGSGTTIAYWDYTGIHMGSGAFISADSWNLASLASGVQNQSGDIRCQYRLTAENMVWIVGTLNPTVAGTWPNPLFTLPSGYRPSATARIPMSPYPTNLGTGFLVVNTSGNVAYDGSTSATAIVINGSFPLGIT